MVKKQKGFFLKACFCVTNVFWSDETPMKEKTKLARRSGAQTTNCWRVQMGAQENGGKAVHSLLA